MNNQKRTGAILNYVNIILSTVTALLFTPIILKYMGKQEYGLYSIVASIVAYFSVLDFGFGNAMVRYASRAKALKNDSESKNINSIFFVLYLVMGVITAIIGIIIYRKFDTIFASSLSLEEIIKARRIMVVLVINIILTFPLSVFSSYVTASEKFIFPRVVNAIRLIIYPLIMYPLLISGYKSLAMVIVLTALNIFSLLLDVYYCFVKLKMKMTLNIKKIDFGATKEIFSYSFFVFLNLIVDSVFNNTDQVILGIFCGTSVVAIYAVANQIKIVYNNLSTAISGVFLPSLSKIIALGNKNNETSKIFIKVSRLQIYLLLLILSGFYIFGMNFLNLWVGDGYTDSYYIVLWLISFSIVPLSQNIGISVLQAMNKHRFRSVVYIIIAIVNVIISIPLAKIYSGIGAAIGSAIATLLGQVIVMNIYYYRVAKLDIPKYWHNLMKISIPVIITAALIKKLLSLYSFSWMTLMLAVLIYSIIYVVYIWVVHTDMYERGLVIDIINKVKFKGRKNI